MPNLIMHVSYDRIFLKGVIIVNKAVAVIAFILFMAGASLVSSEAGTDLAANVTLSKKVTDAKHLKQVSGEITSIDPENKSITVEGVVIIVDEQMLGNLNVGDRVTVDYITKGMNTAVSIMPQLEER